MKIREHFNIKQYHTFGIDTVVSKWIEFSQPDELILFLKEHPIGNKKHFVIGFGSNLLFVNDFDGLLIKPDFRKIKLTEQNNQEVIVTVGSGVIWDDFVQYCVSNGFWGAENLSLIPGCIGAAPVQNVGAYGVEAKDIIYTVRAVHKTTAEERVFKQADCQFSYRNSFFKQSQEWIVLEVAFKLSLIAKPNITYKPLNTIFENPKNISLEAIRETIIQIRESKLPNPDKIGSAGSFFKNPIVDAKTLERLQSVYPDIPFYPFNGNFKLAAGWLIDHLGWKGKTEGGAMVYPHQALVLVNQEQATGREVQILAQKIQEDVFKHFKVHLEPEVIILT